MSFSRFMQGVLKGDIANMQAEEARQAAEQKRKQELKDRAIQFNQSVATTLLGNLDTSRLPAGFDYRSAFQDIGNSTNPTGGVLDLISQMEKKKDLEGLNYVYGKILPSFIKHFEGSNLEVAMSRFGEFATGITDMESLQNKTDQIGGLFEGIKGQTEFSTEQTNLFNLIKDKMTSLNTAVKEGKLEAGVIPTFPLTQDVPKLRQFLNILNNIEIKDNASSDEKASKPSNYNFTIGGNVKTFLKEDSNEFPNIISNMTDMTRELKRLIQKGEIDPNDATFQNEFKMEMNKQFSRALSFYEDPDNRGVTSEGQILDIEAYTKVFKDDPDFAFAKELFTSFEQGIPFNGFLTQDIDDKGGQKEKEIVDYGTGGKLTGEFQNLAVTVGEPNEEALMNKFAHLGTDDKDKEPFVMANMLVNEFPSLFEGGENQLRTIGAFETNRETTDRFFVKLNLFTKEDPSTGNQVPLPVREKIAVLQILANMPTKARKKGRDSFTLNNTQRGYLFALTGSALEENQKTIANALAYINKKADDGDDLLKLIDAQRAAITYGNVGTGFSQGVRRLFNGITGTTGQIDQIRELLIGGGGSQYGFNKADFRSSEDYETALNSAAQFIMDQNQMGVEFGRQASGEVFLAYQIAKYNDEGGRLSNQDFQYNLQAVAGGQASSKAEALAHLSFVRDRFQKDQVKFSNFRFDPSRLSIYTNPDGEIGATRYANVLFSRLDATMQYYQMYSSPNMKQAQLIQNYPVQAKINAGIDKLKSTNTTHTVMVGGQPKKFILYQVIDADTDRARFKDYGGVYAITMGGRTQTVPYGDIDYGSLQEVTGSGGATGEGQEKTYTKLDMGNNTFMVQEKSGNTILQVMTSEEAEKLGIDLNTLQ